MSATTVLFDVDGTLVDSNYLHVQAWTLGLHAVDRDVPAWQVHRALGLDSSLLLERLLGEEVERLGDRVSDVHTEFYLASAEHLRPLPGARDLLRALHGRGVTVVLATSASPEEVEVLRRVLDVDEHVHVVTGSEDAEVAKPRPDLLQTALERAGTDPADAVMVGDAVWDVEAAVRAGVPAVAVRSGGVGADELLAAGARSVHDDAADLLAHVDDGRWLG